MVEEVDCRSDHVGRRAVEVAVDDMPRTVDDAVVLVVDALVVESGGLNNRKRLAIPTVSAVRGGN